MSSGNLGQMLIEKCPDCGDDLRFHRKGSCEICTTVGGKCKDRRFEDEGVPCGPGALRGDHELEGF